MKKITDYVNVGDVIYVEILEVDEKLGAFNSLTRETALETAKKVFEEKELDTTCFENKEFCNSLKSCVSGFEIRIG